MGNFHARMQNLEIARDELDGKMKQNARVIIGSANASNEVQLDF